MTGLPTRKFKVPALAILLAAITFLVYIPALYNDFINWDDGVYVYENLNIRTLDLRLVKWAFTTTELSNWHPLTLISHAVDYSIWKLDPFGYHLTNVIIHSLNAFLVFLISFTLVNAAGRDQSEDKQAFALSAAVVTTLLFALHPLRVESVAWIAERTDVLSAFFYLLSVLAYTRYCSGGARRIPFYFASLVIFALSLMSKPMGVTLPVALLILDFYPFERFKINGKNARAALKKVLIEKLPFFILSLAISAVTIWAQLASGGMRSLDKQPILERLVTACLGYLFYLYKFILPVKLAPIYPSHDMSTLLVVKAAGAFLILLAITVFCLRTAKREKSYIAAWCYYLVTLLPVIGLLQAGLQSSADRFSYLPGLGPAIILGIGVACALRKYSKVAVVGAVAVVAVLLSATTIKQIRIWKDPVTFWSYEISQYPAHPLAHVNRGLAHDDLNRFDEAIEDYTRAIDLLPGFAATYVNRGFVLNELGRYREAIADYDKALRVKPGFDLAYANRGISYRNLGDMTKAIEDLDRAIALNPEFTEAYKNLATAFFMAGDRRAAQAVLRRAAELGLIE